MLDTAFQLFVANSKTSRRPVQLCAQPLFRNTTPSKSLPSNRAPRKFIKIVPVDKNTLLLQTAITSFTLEDDSDEELKTTLRIHSMLHVADLSYYESLQSDMYNMTKLRNGIVLFEMLTSSENIAAQPYPRLKRETGATSGARTAAAALGAVPQGDALNSALPHWRIADIPAEEVPVNRNRTAWPDLSKIVTFCAAFCLPGPEIYLSLFDSVTNRAQFSFRAILAAFYRDKDSTLKGGVPAVRRATFASRMVNDGARSQSNLSGLRNDAAWRAVRETLNQTNEKTRNSGQDDHRFSEIAVLYGAWHSAALCQCAELDGWKFVDVEWRTAMTVKAPHATLTNVAPWVVGFLGYAVYAAMDWVNLVIVLGTAIRDWTSHSGLSTALSLYGLRHIAPYIMFLRWFRVWDEEN